MVELLLISMALVAVQDTVVLRADNPPEWQGMSVRERFRIGALDGAEHEVFGTVASAAIGLDGTLYVLDTQVPVIRHYSTSGDYLGAVGREGEGPGEYRSPIDLEVLADGRLAVWDPQNLRVTTYSPTGEYDASIRVETASIFSFVEDVFEADDQGEFYIKVPLTHRSGHLSGESAWLRVGADGEVEDTIPVPENHGTATYVVSTAEGPRSPFPIETVSTMSPCGYLIMGRTDEYAFYRPLKDGRVLQVRRSYEPIAVRRQERKQWEEYNDRFAKQSEDMGRSFNRPEIPRQKPAFRGLAVDAECRVWISVYGKAYEAEVSSDYLADRERRGHPVYLWRERPEWEVFESNGRFLGRLVLPVGTRFEGARGKTVLGVARGMFDEGYVVVYELVRN